jgi:hypothetical protein
VEPSDLEPSIQNLVESIHITICFCQGIQLRNKPSPSRALQLYIHILLVKSGVKGDPPLLYYEQDCPPHSTDSTPNWYPLVREVAHLGCDKLEIKTHERHFTVPNSLAKSSTLFRCATFQMRLHLAVLHSEASEFLSLSLIFGTTALPPICFTAHQFTIPKPSRTLSVFYVLRPPPAFVSRLPNLHPSGPSGSIYSSETHNNTSYRVWTMY